MAAVEAALTDSADEDRVSPHGGCGQSGHRMLEPDARKQ
jgi:hypothetical protein